MSQAIRIQWANETVQICKDGTYLGPRGRTVNLAGEIERAKSGTVIYSPDTPPPYPKQRRFGRTRIEVRNETTFSALQRLADGTSHIACLNFASAKHPGGGFLSGAQAQEEALARSSALYPCLLRVPDYYERNRANRSAIYLDLVIFSPLVPFFRDDSGALLETPILASVITAPAPNAGALADGEPGNMVLLEPALRRRAELVLQTAQGHGVDKLVLGAWGCGVFRNDPRMVARIFSELLGLSGPFDSAFTEVAFAVFDPSREQATYKAFVDVFGTGADE
jgi:TIGR02452 family protein